MVEWGIVGTERQGLNKGALSVLFRVAEPLGVGYDGGVGRGLWGDAKNGELNIEKGTVESSRHPQEQEQRALTHPARLACAAYCLPLIVQCLFSPLPLSVQLFPKKEKKP